MGRSNDLKNPHPGICQGEARAPFKNFQNPSIFILTFNARYPILCAVVWFPVFCKGFEMMNSSEIENTLRRVRANLRECRDIMQEMKACMDEMIEVPNNCLPLALRGKENADKLGKSPTLRIVKQRMRRLKSKSKE